MFMNIVWNLLSDMSQIMILSMISINVPGIVLQVQATLLNFIYFDIFETDLWLSELVFTQKELNNDIPLNAYFAANGYNSLFSERNLSSTFLFILAMGFMHLLAFLMRWFRRFLCKW